jgi:hypothetical protein
MWHEMMGWLMSRELDRLWKEEAISQKQILYWHLLGGGEEKGKNLSE